MTLTPRTRKVKADGVKLAVREYGHERGRSEGAPTIVLVHGYPDNQAIWEPVAEILADDFHVVTYDVRGAGESSRPRRTKAYVMENLGDDLAAVIDAVSPGRPVHLVGHDWGSVQSWGAVTGDRLGGRAASFTSISGPCIEHFGQWVRDRLRRPTPRNVGQLFGQFARSWYLMFGAIPGVPQLTWRLGGAKVFPVVIERMEGIERRPGPTFLKDALYGMKLYRANALRFLRPGDMCRTGVPVQAIAPTRDAFVSPHQSKDVGRYVDRFWRREIPVGHWGSVRKEPALVADWVAQFVWHIEGAPESAELRAAQVPAVGEIMAGSGA
ncbi:alpha/beta fold hydrolase [Actinomadura barringtoniae]|uniref:Alpha/beta fold hydrolase n=1 Tax=Actinomadura barringtoniae TaxID=1427535 RepID=A0A939PJ92_9ACTN|nr:alpha/beta fold hydrolase [Actinomadura barringtoniae]MBO2453927.1 alpha/beta fold hydrolase [Actinomadura barringtoniae]